MAEKRTAEEVKNMKKRFVWLLENILLPVAFSSATSLLVMKLLGQL